MKFSQVMSSSGEWLRGEGPHHQVVVSSRVRLARNLRHRAFPGWAKKAERTQVLEQIRPHVEALSEMQDSFSELLQDLSALEKQVLVERHLISREHAAKGVGSAVIMNRRQTLSIMINEEDHLRMQSIRSGLQLKSAFKLVDKVDSTLESNLDIAYDPRLGYLTACPTNVGTGMRASAMLHLPGLVLSDLINQVIQAVNKIGRRYHWVAIRRDACTPDVAVGSYVGNDADNRPITGVGFSPTYVMVKRAADATIGFQRFAAEVGDASLPINAGSSETTNRIQAMLADGFEVGTHTAVNAAPATYYWVAFRAVSGGIVSATFEPHSISAPVSARSDTGNGSPRSRPNARVWPAAADAMQ